MTSERLERRNSIKTLWLLAIPLFALHAIEEYFFSFPSQDPLIKLFSAYLHLDTLSIFFILQIFLGILLIVPLFVGFKRWWNLIIGIILVSELEHIAMSVSLREYYPGFYTSIFLVILGIFFWRELLKTKTHVNGS